MHGAPPGTGIPPLPRHRRTACPRRSRHSHRHGQCLEPQTKLIRDWFAKRLRWHMHFTPTSASWINQVERFFALLTDQQIKRGAHRSTAALEASIAAYIDARNADPKPFRWTKTADDILASIQRFCH